MATKLLLVEDNENIRFALQDTLTLEGFEVTAVDNLALAKSAFMQNDFSGVILDIMLPDGDGYSFSRWVRERNQDLFILMLTARELERDLVEGFEAGADDYMTKPFSTLELMHRLSALLKRSRNNRFLPHKNDGGRKKVCINGCLVNCELRQVTRENKEIQLSDKAFSLLIYLFDSLNKVCSRQDILSEVWGKDKYIDERTVDNFISQLKKELALHPDNEFFVKTVRGVGYSLVKK